MTIYAEETTVGFVLPSESTGAGRIEVVYGWTGVTLFTAPEVEVREGQDRLAQLRARAAARIGADSDRLRPTPADVIELRPAQYMSTTWQSD